MQQWQGQETPLRRLGKAFNLYADDIAHEPLPRRWVEIIRYLDEQERRSSSSRNERLAERPHDETEHAITTSFCAN